MFTYYFIDNLGLRTVTEFAYDKDMAYLESLVALKQYKSLVIVERFF